MTRNYINAQEGNLVYITHRFPITEPKTKSKYGFGESGVRGIVQGGKCYKITIEYVFPPFCERWRKVLVV